ncbi:hypothetical protein [Terrisporobacter petrolearius]|uniref:hypothetical protein n=1 Tax=Terrisporobacter petrolearius TaxID=1460447 RepID=UPI003AFFBFB5
MRKIYYIDYALLLLILILSIFIFRKLYINFSFYKILIYINRKFKIVTEYKPSQKGPLKETLAGLYLIIVKIILIFILVGTSITNIVEFTLIEIFLFPGYGVYVLFYSYLYGNKIVTVSDGIINLDDVKKIHFNSGLLIQTLDLELKDSSKKQIGMSLDEYKRIVNKLEDMVL